MVIDALNSYEERERSISGLVMFSGFRQIQVTYERQKRYSGLSKWSFNRKLGMMTHIIVQFSMFPIRAVSLTGIATALFAFLFLMLQIVRRLVYGTEVPGFTLLSVLIVFFGGAQLAMLGVLGEYLWRTLESARRRPLFFVQRLQGRFCNYEMPLPPGLATRVPSAACPTPYGQRHSRVPTDKSHL
jgi:polyisoprenyl-phosphate glycosyltransferase